MYGKTHHKRNSQKSLMLFQAFIINEIPGSRNPIVKIINNIQIYVL